MQLLSPLHLNKHVSTLHKQRRQQSDDIAKEMEKRQGKSATYTQLLQGRDEAEQQDMESFLTEFYGGGIFDKAREMRTLVRHHPATVGTHYALLVPDVVSFDQFWSRYFYRCSSTTILQDLRRSEKAEAEEENDPATTTTTRSDSTPSTKDTPCGPSA